MNWDGSFLGRWNNKDVTFSGNNPKYLYITESIQGYAIKVKDFLACLLDELKPLFGMDKVGTHSLIISGSKYVLFKQHNLYRSRELLVFTSDMKLKMEMRKQILFHRIFHINLTEKNIFFSAENGNVNKICIIGNMSYNHNLKISPTLKKNWLTDDYDYQKDANTLFKTNDYRQLINDLSLFVESTVKRIDKMLITYKSILLSKLTIFV